MDGTLSCDSRGEMGGAIRCQEFVCGKPPVVDEGFSSATSNLTVEYKCAGSKFVKVAYGNLLNPEISPQES